jgi:hypothetical protein
MGGIQSLQRMDWKDFKKLTVSFFKATAASSIGL